MASSRSAPALRTTGAGQSGNAPGMGGRLPTYLFMTRNRRMIAFWLVVIEYKLQMWTAPHLSGW
jgi:hypothetical protein